MNQHTAIEFLIKKICFQMPFTDKVFMENITFKEQSALLNVQLHVLETKQPPITCVTSKELEDDSHFVYVDGLFNRM